ncbi:MAG: NAD-dependent epimerase/dehydratase family protein [Cyanothece sp. SIO1E1]|nr:NAD-dependent epimerase/dehydratase family protein [Cyanothece sp. SIO1E1]
MPTVVEAITQAVIARHGLSIEAIALVKPGSIPKTSSGKIQRHACRTAFLNDTLKHVNGGKREPIHDARSHPFQVETGVSVLAFAHTSDFLPQLKAAPVTQHRELLMTHILGQVAQVLGLTASQPIHPNQTLIDLNLDSLMAAELKNRLEISLRCSISITTFFDHPTLATLVDHLLEKLFGTETADSTQSTIDLSAEVALDPTIGPTLTTMPAAAAKTSMLLTGATGFLGAFLLFELLRHTEADVYCLVRADHINAGQARIQANMESYQLWHPDFAQRVIPVIGDLSQPQLGWSSEQFQQMAKQIDTIYHNGALLNYIYPYSRLKPANVLGTQAILRLASSRRMKPVHYISSTAVFDYHLPILKHPIVNESHPIDCTTGMYLGYSQSKWVADKLVQLAGERKIPVFIYRPGLIAGHSHTGVVNTADFIWRTIKGSIQMGYIPDIDIDIDLSAVDYVSQSIVYLSQQNELESQIFHLNNAHPMPWSQLIQFLHNFGYPVHVLSLKSWLEKLTLLVRPNPENALHSLVPFFLERWSPAQLTLLELMQANKSPQVSCQQTLDILAHRHSEIICPALDHTLWQTYFSYFINSGFLQAP